ncbi:MAG: hypothetical protein HXX12_08990 [Geothrix sp.]|uniref:hypothetical protein n=1 Tax=Geothrix sp. TaxID=1962974 RepID=UPI0017A92137|nr:hypothetical protein [Geothrix sp.]NWJ41090.1 hypothetical protein [Geothrix sp.]WIL20918.1 MAG: hypothetical protein QOZ81_000153 [Geothrix sp.]
MKAALATGSSPRRQLRNAWLGLAVLSAMVLHTYLKWRWGTLPELLWGCNVASFVIVMGLFLDHPAMVGTGFLWHVGVGEPGYVFGVIQTGHTTWVSVLVHSLPTVAAFLSLRRTGLPRPSPWLAFLLFVALVPISHYLTPARFNVNLAHERLWVLQRHFPGNWDYRFAFSAIMLAILLLADWGFGAWFGRPGGKPDSLKPVGSA